MRKYYIYALLFASLFQTGCDILDKKDLSAVTEEDVWTDKS